MKLFVRGGVGLVAVLFAAFFIFYPRLLLAETSPSLEPAQEQQQKKQELTGHTQGTRQTEPANVQSATAELSGTVSGATSTAVKDNDLASAASVKIASPAARRSAPLTAPRPFTAFLYSLRGRGASGLGVRRGTIAADPRVLPYGTRVYMEAGSYSGEYLVTDCGTAINGNKIDVWVPTIAEARRFGRKNVKLTVLSYGGKRGAKRSK